MHAETWQQKIKIVGANPRIIFGASILLVAITISMLAPWLAPYPADAMDITKRLAPPSYEHWLGCDLNGADILTAIMYGGRTSLYIGFLTVCLTLSIGVLVGLVSGYWRGWIEHGLMRLVDILMAFPGILLAMALAALLGPNVHNVVLAIAATGWTSAARLVRGQVLTLREREYVTASRALGATDARIIFRHILPGTVSTLLIHATFSLSAVILIEASLSFLGLGAQDGPPSWGALLNQGRAALTEAPHLSLAPGAAIALIVLSLNFVGDALRDIFDPKNND